MSLNRYNARRDSNEKSIVQALKQAGASVARISEAGMPDLIVWHPRCGIKLVEVKTAKGDLTAAQVSTHRSMPVVVVRTVEEALALVLTK